MTKDEARVLDANKALNAQARAETDSAIAEAAALVEGYIVGAKHVRIRVVTLRRLLAALK